ncbi:MAG: hypothetical protein ABI789_04620 [Usitatibacter sp.]
MPLAGKPISAYQRTASLPARWESRATRFEKPPLWEFVLLSMALHGLAITLFGAPSGGSREGRAMWGELQVVLQGYVSEPAPTLKIDRVLPMLRAPTVEKLAPPAPVPPAIPERRVEPVAAPVEAPPPDPPPPVDVPVFIPPLLDRILVPDRKLEALQPWKMPPPTEVKPAPVPIPPAPPALPREAPKAEEPPAPPRVEQRAPAEAPAVAVPLVQPKLLPERAVAPPVEQRVETPVVPVAPATPPVERAPVEVPPLPVPLPESVAPQLPPAIERIAPAPSIQRDAPARIERAPAAPTTQPELRSPSLPSPVAPAPAFRSREQDPSSGYDPTAPALDLDAMRKRAATMAREGSGNRAILPFPMPAPPARKTKEQIAIENARKPDCRTAYQSLGLAAVVPLIANEFGEGSCRW